MQVTWYNSCRKQPRGAAGYYSLPFLSCFWKHHSRNHLISCLSIYLQKQATVRSSVVEVLLEITKFCDLYLMERVLDDESEVCSTWHVLIVISCYHRFSFLLSLLHRHRMSFRNNCAE